MITICIIIILTHLLSVGFSGKYRDLYTKEKELRLVEREKYELEIFELLTKNKGA